MCDSCRWVGALGCCRCQVTLSGLPACLRSQQRILLCQVRAEHAGDLQHCNTRMHVLPASHLSLSHRLPAQLPAHMDTFLSPYFSQFERESSRALSKELVAARERWRSTEAERAAAEDLRRRAWLPALHACSVPSCMPVLLSARLVWALSCRAQCHPTCLLPTLH
jgi:hypothetical protein